MEFALRAAAAADAVDLTTIVVAAMKAQGRWRVTAADEPRWRDRYAAWTRERLADEHDHLSVVESSQGRAIGRLRVLRPADARRLELAGIQLLPEVQGRGVGTAIVRGLQSEAAELGVPLELGVEKDNPRAQRLYERLGFVRFDESDAEYLMRWTARPSA